jgi:hypothetical protein
MISPFLLRLPLKYNEKKVAAAAALVTQRECVCVKKVAWCDARRQEGKFTKDL